MKHFDINIILVALLLSLPITFLGNKYIGHLEIKDKRHVEQEEAQNKRYLALCEKLDCVNPKMIVKSHKGVMRSITRKSKIKSKARKKK